MLEASDDAKNGAVADADLADVEPAVQVKRERAVDVRVLQRAVLDHQPVAGRAFFAGLEAKDERAARPRRAVGSACAPPLAGSPCGRRDRMRASRRRASSVGSTSLISRTGSASMSARSNVTGPGFPPRQRRQHAGLADPGADLVEPVCAEVSATKRAVSNSTIDSSGLRVQMAACADHLRR